MADVETCRHDALAAVLTFLSSVPFAHDQNEVCDQPAEHLAVVQRDGDGIQVEVYVRVCTQHERLASLIEGYKRSIKLRQST